MKNSNRWRRRFLRIRKVAIETYNAIRAHLHVPQHAFDLRLHVSKIIHPRWTYVTALILVLLLLTVGTTVALSPRIGAVAIPTVIDFIQRAQAHPELLYYSIRSVIRLTIGYFLSLVTALGLGLLATQHKKIGGILIPMFDIMQSVPALAFFPIIFIVSVNMFGASVSGFAPGGLENGKHVEMLTGVGVEIASILLLITGMLWYQLFNIIGAILAIPKDIIEAANLFGIRGWNYFRHIILPAVFPGIVTGGIQSWGEAGMLQSYQNTCPLQTKSIGCRV